MDFEPLFFVAKKKCIGWTYFRAAVRIGTRMRYFAVGDFFCTHGGRQMYPLTTLLPRYHKDNAAPKIPVCNGTTADAAFHT